jgi:hypothetical protein
MLYRAHWKAGLVILAVSVPMLLLGSVAFLIAIRQDPFGALISLAGIAVALLFVRQGLSILSQRYEIETDRLSVRDSVAFRRDGFAWSDVESWLVWPRNAAVAAVAADSIRRIYPEDGLPRPRSDYRGVVFRVRGRVAHFLIGEWEVSVPSFEKFLADVRGRIGDREIGTIAAASTVAAVADEAIQSDRTSIRPSLD